MTVDQKKRSSEEDSKDRFPVGMRVLAVDDDPTCLKVLETLLRKCKYHVTTTDQAVAALKMLRENKNSFDLVISDVRMPDMDGFKLLELVGLEMDLPVIMLSAFGNTELVMQGVSHGACDYLLKPVRMEELQNIWQHVLRKKKGKTKEQREVSMQTMANRRNESGAHDAPLSDNARQNDRKLNRKRKDQEEDEDEDGEDEDNESEETSNHKKPRVVWSIELHQKFVAAVNQLGIDKAVPKKILDIMDVEGLTRENVASHLQKYRIYLKKASNNADNQQANPAFYWKDSSFMHMASLEGHRDFRTSTAVPPGRLSSTGLSSYFSGGVLSRLNNNTPSGLHQNPNNAITSFGKLQPSLVFPSVQNSNLFPGIPTTLGTDHRLQQNKFVPSPLIANTNSLAEPSSFLLPSSSFPNPRTGIDNSYNIFNSSPLLQGNSQNLHNTGGFGIQSSVSLNQEPFKIDNPIGSSNFLDHNRYNGGFGSQNSVPLNPGAMVSSNILDHGRTDESWTNTALTAKLPPSSLPISQPFHQDASTPNGSLKDRNFSSAGSKAPYNPIDFTSNYVISAPMGNGRADMQTQVGLIDNVVQNQKYSSSFKQQTWESNTSTYNAFSKLGSLHSTNDGSRNMDMPTAGKFNGSSSTTTQPEGENVSVLDPKMKTGSGGYLHQLQQDGDFAELGFDSLDDLMSPMVKREHETMLLDGEFGLDGYSLGSSCI